MIQRKYGSAPAAPAALTNPKLVAARTRDRVAEVVISVTPRLGSRAFGCGHITARQPVFLDAATDLLSESGYCVVVGDLRGSTRKDGLYARALRDGQLVGARSGTWPEQKPGTLQTGRILSRPDGVTISPGDRDAAMR